jgi:hypothetical protein
MKGKLVDNSSKKDENYWILYSPFTVRQNEVGRCAEKNGGTLNCVSGKCDLCAYCSCNKRGKKSK